MKCSTVTILVIGTLLFTASVKSQFLVNLAIDGVVSYLRSSLDPLNVTDVRNDLNLSGLLVNVNLASLKMRNITLFGLQNMTRLQDGDVVSTDDSYAVKITMGVRAIQVTAVVVPSVGQWIRVDYPIPTKIDIDNMTVDFQLTLTGYELRPSVDHLSVRHFQNVRPHLNFGFALHYFTDPIARALVSFFNGAFRVMLGDVLQTKFNQLLEDYPLNPFV